MPRILDPTLFLQGCIPTPVPRGELTLSHLVTPVSGVECGKASSACPQLSLHRLGLLAEMSPWASRKSWQTDLTQSTLILRFHCRPFNAGLLTEMQGRVREQVGNGNTLRR